VNLSTTIHLLGETLGEVLRTQESVALFETEERIRALAKARRAGDQAAATCLADEVRALSTDAARATASAFAVYFDLVNLAEETQRIRALRERERAQHPAPIGESVGAAMARLKAQGVTAHQMKTLLESLRIELVLTAHPTEAKRRTVLSKLQRIAMALRRLHDADLLPREYGAETTALRAEIAERNHPERCRADSASPSKGRRSPPATPIPISPIGTWSRSSARCCSPPRRCRTTTPHVSGARP